MLITLFCNEYLVRNDAGEPPQTHVNDLAAVRLKPNVAEQSICRWA